MQNSTIPPSRFFLINLPSEKPPWTCSDYGVLTVDLFLSQLPDTLRTMSSDLQLDYAIFSLGVVRQSLITQRPNISPNARKKVHRLGDDVLDLVDNLERLKHGDQPARTLSHRERDSRNQKGPTRPADEWKDSLRKRVKKMEVELDELQHIV